MSGAVVVLSCVSGRHAYAAMLSMIVLNSGAPSPVSTEIDESRSGSF